MINYNGEWLPPDWVVHVTREGARYRVTVERAGKFMSLEDALILRDALTTSSNRYNRRPIAMNNM